MNPPVQLVPFIADSAADAVRQIRTQLGPDAVVVNVRHLPATGLSRLWQTPKIEVLACRPSPPAEPRLPARALSPAAYSTSLTRRSALTPAEWQLPQLLERSGMLPLAAQRVCDHIQARFGPAPPDDLSDEIALARAALVQLWKPAAPVLPDSWRPHVFVGPAGSGKTTCLCKWLAQTVLIEQRPARVWRLDAAIANTAESLSIFCEILGVPLERSWIATEPPRPHQTHFIDLPGVDWRHADALASLALHLTEFRSPHVHLVLNAAYDIQLLLAQTRAFAALPIDDLILTHLDEELRWGKLWNLALGTNYSVRFFSSGQNVPGDFWPATPERLLSRQFSA